MNIICGNKPTDHISEPIDQAASVLARPQGLQRCTWEYSSGVEARRGLSQPHPPPSHPRPRCLAGICWHFCCVVSLQLWHECGGVGEAEGCESILPVSRRRTATKSIRSVGPAICEPGEPAR